MINDNYKKAQNTLNDTFSRMMWKIAPKYVNFADIARPNSIILINRRIKPKEAAIRRCKWRTLKSKRIWS